MQEDVDAASSGNTTGSDVKGTKRKSVGGRQKTSRQKRSAVMGPPPARVATGGGAKEILLARMKSLMQQAEATESAPEKRRLLSEIKRLQLGATKNTAQQTQPKKPGQEEGTVSETNASTPEKADVEVKIDT